MSTQGRGDRGGLRADAARNRIRVAEAAREVFAQHGPDAPIAEIARRAGVGTATLYRRFPTRESLFALVFEDRIGDCAATVSRLLSQSETDPWAAFAGYIDALFALQRDDRAFTAALLQPFDTDEHLERERQRATDGLAELIRRAQAARALRSDFGPKDVELLLAAHDGVIAHHRDSVRAAELLLRACRRP